MRSASRNFRYCEEAPLMTERFKDFLAGLFLPALIAVMLLGGWVLLRVMVH
jgi:hypothetical protein